MLYLPLERSQNLGEHPFLRGLTIVDAVRIVPGELRAGLSPATGTASQSPSHASGGVQKIIRLCHLISPAARGAAVKPRM